MIQLGQIISHEGLSRIVDQIFDLGSPVVTEAYSEYDSVLRRFGRPSDLLGDIFPIGNKKFSHYSFYYPASQGYVIEKRIALDPLKCSGHTFRFTLEGWGIFALQCGFITESEIDCRIAVNSQKRAEKWYPTYPEWKSPDLWNWKLIASIERKLKRTLKQKSEPVLPAVMPHVVPREL